MLRKNLFAATFFMLISCTLVEGTGSCVAAGYTTCCKRETSYDCFGMNGICFCDSLCHDFEDCCDDIAEAGCPKGSCAAVNITGCCVTHQNESCNGSGDICRCDKACRDDCCSDVKCFTTSSTAVFATLTPGPISTSALFVSMLSTATPNPTSALFSINLAMTTSTGQSGANLAMTISTGQSGTNSAMTTSTNHSGTSSAMTTSTIMLLVACACGVLMIALIALTASIIVYIIKKKRQRVEVPKSSPSHYHQPAATNIYEVVANLPDRKSIDLSSDVANTYTHLTDNTLYEDVTTNVADMHVTDNTAYNQVTNNVAYTHITDNGAYDHVTDSVASTHITDSKMYECVTDNITANVVYTHVVDNIAYGHGNM